MKKQGFTLIELIVVMAIILVLGTLLLPKYNGYRSKAENLKIVDTGRQIYLAAIESFTEGNGDFNEEEVKEVINELIGIDDVDVEDDGTEIQISYSIDSKQYTLTFNERTSGFLIKDSSGKQMHPKVNNKKELDK